MRCVASCIGGIAATLGLVLAFAPGLAHAYSEGATFALPAIEGGGGGRQFTGSFADGYTCAVCHGDAPAEPPTISGLPAAGFADGETYELAVQWAPGARRAGLALELVDARGAAAGTLTLVGAGDADELCRPDAMGLTPRAAALVTPPPTVTGAARSVLTVDGCGASATRVLWTAPPTATGSVFVNLAYVRADGTGGPDLDATAELAVQVPPLDVPADARRLDGGCAISAPRAAANAYWLAWIFVALAVSAYTRPRERPSARRRWRRPAFRR